MSYWLVFLASLLILLGDELYGKLVMSFVIKIDYLTQEIFYAKIAIKVRGSIHKCEYL